MKYGRSRLLFLVGDWCWCCRCVCCSRCGCCCCRCCSRCCCYCVASLTSSRRDKLLIVHRSCEAPSFPCNEGQLVPECIPRRWKEMAVISREGPLLTRHDMLLQDSSTARNASMSGRYVLEKKSPFPRVLLSVAVYRTRPPRFLRFFLSPPGLTL